MSVFDSYYRGQTSRSGGSFADRVASSQKAWNAEEERKRKKKQAAETLKKDQQQRKQSNSYKSSTGSFEFTDPNTGKKTSMENYIRVKGLDEGMFIQSLADRGYKKAQSILDKQRQKENVTAMQNRQRSISNAFRPASLSPENPMNPIKRIDEMNKPSKSTLVNDMYAKNKALAEESKRRNESVSFLDKTTNYNGKPIRGTDVKIKFDGQDVSFGDLIKNFNSKSRFEQDMMIRHLQDTIKKNRFDFGDQETKKLREDAQTAQFVLQQRGEWKANTPQDMALHTLNTIPDMARSMGESTTAIASALHELNPLSGGSAAAQKELEKQLKDGNITKREYAQAMNRLYNDAQPLVGDGIDKGVVDRLMRLTGTFLDTPAGFVLPVGGVAKVGKAAKDIGGVNKVIQASLKSAGVAGAYSGGVTLKEGVDLKPSDFTVAVLSGMGFGAVAGAVGAAVAKPMKDIFNKVKAKKTLTAAEEQQFNNFVSQNNDALKKAIGKSALAEPKPKPTIPSKPEVKPPVSSMTPKKEFMMTMKAQLKGTSAEGGQTVWESSKFRRKTVQISELKSKIPDNPHVVKQWETRIKSGDRPNVLTVNGEVVDGVHKLQAYKNLGISDVPTIEATTKKISGGEKINPFSPKLDARWKAINKQRKTSSPKPSPEASLKQEALKYKSAEEFVDSYKSKSPDYAVGEGSGHTAPIRNDFNAPAHELTKIYPKDVYENGTKYYGSGYDQLDAEVMPILNKIKNNPDAEVTIYRTVPKGKGIKDFNRGDWVTLTKGYAKEHGESNLGGKYEILSKKVKADEVFTDANSLQEFGYDPRPKYSKQQLTDLYNQAHAPKRISSIHDEAIQKINEQTTKEGVKSTHDEYQSKLAKEVGDQANWNKVNDLQKSIADAEVARLHQLVDTGQIDSGVKAAKPAKSYKPTIKPRAEEVAGIRRVGDTELPTTKAGDIIGDTTPIKKGNIRPDPMITLSGRVVQLKQYNPKLKRTAHIEKEWSTKLLEAAIEEAKFRNDSMNLAIFKDMLKRKDFVNSDAELYLFGEPGVKLTYTGKPQTFGETTPSSAAKQTIEPAPVEQPSLLDAKPQKSYKPTPAETGAPAQKLTGVTDRGGNVFTEQSITVSRLVRKKEYQPRTTESGRATEKSVYEKGYNEGLVDQPLLVWKRGDEYIVLGGHSRTKGMERRAAEGKANPQKVNARVYENLTPEKARQISRAANQGAQYESTLDMAKSISDSLSEGHTPSVQKQNMIKGYEYADYKYLWDIVESDKVLMDKVFNGAISHEDMLNIARHARKKGMTSENTAGIVNSLEKANKFTKQNVNMVVDLMSGKLNAKLQADAQTGLFGDIESSVNALDLLQEYKKTNAEFVSRLNAVKKATKELSPDSAAYKEMAGVQADLQAKLDDIVNQIRIRHNAKIAEDNLLRIATQELGAFEGKNWLKNYRENAEKMHTKPKKIKAGDKVIDERGQTRIVQQKNINDMQALLDKASSMNNPFHKKMERVSKELGYEYQRGPIKGIDRATEKLVADYGGDTRQMKDVLRGTIVIDNPNDIGRVVEAMRKNFKVVDEYSKFDQINATYVGYKDSKIITIHNGVYRETLVATPEMLKAKYELQGHVLYEQYRVKMNDWERTGKVMNRLYSEAEELTVRRIESSRGTSDSSIGEPSTTARMGENGALMNKLSATTSPSSTNTLMGSPSTSKNAGNVVGNFDRISSPFSESIAKNTSVVKTKESRVFERLKLEYPEIRGEHTYNTTTLKNEAIKADNLLAKDVHEAYRVAMNAADVSEVESVATNIAMTERALKEGNNSLASRLILNRSLAQTRRGQAIVMEKASIQNNQTSKFVKELIQRRMDTVKTTPLAESNLRLPGKKKKPSVTDIIDIEAKKIEKQVKFKEMDVKDAQSFINGLICK